VTSHRILDRPGGQVLDIDTLVAAVASTKKYRALCEDTVRRVAESELAALPGGNLKAAVKATKRRLHQACSAFEEEADYEAAYQRLAIAVQAGSEAEVRAACRHILGLHHSTRERLPILDRFYSGLWQVTGRPGSVLDLGCGLNPLAWPWMDLKAGCQYTALDIDRDRIEFLNRVFSLAGMEPLARCQDVLAHPPGDRADVALLLKMSPTLERQEPSATARLIEGLASPFVVVSFAVKSLGGREKGMVGNYRRHFQDLAERRGWQVTKLEFETELVFVVVRHD
jgi:16S rRNA (guanine(1405)-N(7))-methyltransferase